jgi:hypothetical protein
MSDRSQALFFSLILVSSAIMISFPYQKINIASAERPCFGDSEFLYLKHIITGGKVQLMCFYKGVQELVIYLNATAGGEITIEIPRTLMDIKGKNCDDLPLYTQSPSYAEIKDYKTPTLRVVKLPASNFIIIGYQTPEYKSLMGMDCKVKESKFPTPRQQLVNGVFSEDVGCPDNLQLIFKSSHSSPVCVKPQTATKLVEHGWKSVTSDSNNCKSPTFAVSTISATLNGDVVNPTTKDPSYVLLSSDELDKNPTVKKLLSNVLRNAVTTNGLILPTTFEITEDEANYMISIWNLGIIHRSVDQKVTDNYVTKFYDIRVQTPYKYLVTITETYKC